MLRSLEKKIRHYHRQRHGGRTLCKLEESVSNIKAKNKEQDLRDFKKKDFDSDK